MTVRLTVTVLSSAVGRAEELAAIVGVAAVPFASPPGTFDPPVIPLLSPQAVKLLAGTFFQTIDALTLPLGLLGIALLWALLFGGLFNAPWWFLGLRKRLWSVVLVDREAMLPVYAEPSLGAAKVYNFPPTARGIRSLGPPKRSGKVVWLPIDTPNGSGWVEASFLTEEVDPKTFGGDRRPTELAREFVAALSSKEPRTLRKLTSNRGLIALRFGQVVVVPQDRFRALLEDHKREGWWRSDPVTAMEALFPERLAGPFLDAYWGNDHTGGGASGVTTALIPAEIHNFHRFSYPTPEGTWWLIFEYRKGKAFVAGVGFEE